MILSRVFGNVLPQKNQVEAKVMESFSKYYLKVEGMRTSSEFLFQNPVPIIELIVHI